MDVVAISKSDALAILDNGDVVRFTNMFDAFGNETNDVELAVTAVVPLPDKTWAAIDFHDYEPVSIH